MAAIVPLPTSSTTPRKTLRDVTFRLCNTGPLHPYLHHDERGVMTAIKWTHPSVVRLLEQATDDPLSWVERRPRELALTAMEKGWEGPPYGLRSSSQLPST